MKPANNVLSDRTRELENISQFSAYVCISVCKDSFITNIAGLSRTSIYSPSEEIDESLSGASEVGSEVFSDSEVSSGPEEDYEEVPAGLTNAIMK